jgi:hypothetical protein
LEGGPHGISGTWRESGRVVYVLALGSRSILTYHDTFSGQPGLRHCACSWFGQLEGDLIMASDTEQPSIRAYLEEGELHIEPASGLRRCCYDSDDEDFSPGSSSTSGVQRVEPTSCVTKRPSHIFGAEGSQEIPEGTRIWSLLDEETGTYAAALVGGSAVVGKGPRDACEPR